MPRFRWACLRSSFTPNSPLSCAQLADGTKVPWGVTPYAVGALLFKGCLPLVCVGRFVQTAAPALHLACHESGPHTVPVHVTACPQELFGPEGWCNADDPKFKCPCRIDGIFGINCMEPVEVGSWFGCVCWLVDLGLPTLFESRLNQGHDAHTQWLTGG